MFVQVENTPNPNSLKFLPGKKVSKIGPIEILDKKDTTNELAKEILSLNGVRGIFLYEDFLSVNKTNNVEWSDIKHIIISYINDFYSKGNEYVISEINSKKELNLLKIHAQSNTNPHKPATPTYNLTPSSTSNTHPAIH